MEECRLKGGGVGNRNVRRVLKSMDMFSGKTRKKGVLSTIDISNRYRLSLS